MGLRSALWRTASPLGSRTVRENYDATVAAGAQPRRRLLSLVVSHRMLRILVSCAFISVIVVVACTVYLRHVPSRLEPREIAAALVEFHHLWETNGYRSPKTGTPRALESPSIHAYSASIYGAYVQYQSGLCGVEWSRRYHIIRASTNDSVWTLYDIRCLERPRVTWLTWSHKMITVTNNL